MERELTLTKRTELDGKIWYDIHFNGSFVRCFDNLKEAQDKYLDFIKNPPIAGVVLLQTTKI